MRSRTLRMSAVIYMALVYDLHIVAVVVAIPVAAQMAIAILRRRR